MRPCFTFKAATATKPAVLAIDDEIGLWGMQAMEFRKALDGVAGQDLDVEINSPGGDVMAGLGMYHMLRTAAANGVKVTTRVTGLAASIANVVLLAGDKREMPKNTFGMVHSVKGYQGYATADEMREMADVTEKIHNQVKQIYIDRAGVDETKATEIMAKDTWLTAAECQTLGLATDILEDVQAIAKFDVTRADLPAHVAAVFKAQAEKPVEAAPTAPVETVAELPVVPDDNAEPTDASVAGQVVAMAKVAGLETHGAALALAHTTVAEAKARIGDLVEIAALCSAVGKPEYVATAVAKNKSVADVRAHLIEAQAQTDVHTDTAKPADETNGGTKSSGVNPTALWDSHNAQRKKDR